MIKKNMQFGIKLKWTRINKIIKFINEKVLLFMANDYYRVDRMAPKVSKWLPL